MSSKSRQTKQHKVLVRAHKMKQYVKDQEERQRKLDEKPTPREKLARMGVKSGSDLLTEYELIQAGESELNRWGRDQVVAIVEAQQEGQPA